MTELVFPCGCSEDVDLKEMIPQLYCPMQGAQEIKVENEE